MRREKALETLLTTHRRAGRLTPAVEKTAGYRRLLAKGDPELLGLYLEALPVSASPRGFLPRDPDDAGDPGARSAGDRVPGIPSGDPLKRALSDTETEVMRGAGLTEDEFRAGLQRAATLQHKSAAFLAGGRTRFPTDDARDEGEE